MADKGAVKNVHLQTYRLAGQIFGTPAFVTRFVGLGLKHPHRIMLRVHYTICNTVICMKYIQYQPDLY